MRLGGHGGGVRSGPELGVEVHYVNEEYEEALESYTAAIKEEERLLLVSFSGV